MGKRQCGECAACCAWTRLEFLPDKPRGELCPHAHTDTATQGRCSIYETRPSVCKGFSCSWLDGYLDNDARPDRSGMLFETMQFSNEIGPVEPTILLGIVNDIDKAREYTEERIGEFVRHDTAILLASRDPDGKTFIAGDKRGVAVIEAFLRNTAANGLEVRYADGNIERISAEELNRRT